MVWSCYATLILCLHFIEYEFNSEKVCQILHIFLTRYPNNTLFLWIGALVAQKLSKLPEAEFLSNQALMACGE